MVDVTDFQSRTNQWVTVRVVQCNYPNANALSIYRGVTYTNSTGDEELSNTAQVLNTKITNYSTGSTSKGDVIT